MAAPWSEQQPAVGPQSPIPEKLYFKIGEVSSLVGVQAHVLRYWEKEIPSIRPGKSQSNQRRYRRKDVELFREIKRLLHEERYTLAGARKRLNLPGGVSASANLESATEHEELSEQLGLAFGTKVASEQLERVRTGLKDLIRLAGEEP